MGKRSNFKRKPRDLYRTPYKAVVPLLKHLPQDGRTFYEPCAADGRLVSYLSEHMRCAGASDIKPAGHPMELMYFYVYKLDMFDLTREHLNGADMIITNPTWQRQLKGEDGKLLPSDEQPLHKAIDHFRRLAPTWLLLDADWMHTVQAKPYLPYCSKIVSVGRVSWEENGVAGKDNAAWYLFEPTETHIIEFYGRA